MTDPVCPVSGAPMRRDVRPMTLSYKGQSVTFDMPGWYCDASDESSHTGADMKVSDRMLNRLKAQVEGLLEPADIRRIRRRLGLTQAEAGDLIGGGPRAFQKYEAGDLLPSRAVSSALRLLDRDPAAVAVLYRRRGGGGAVEPASLTGAKSNMAGTSPAMRSHEPLNPDHTGSHG